MSREIIEKKLDQILELLGQLESWLSEPLADVQNDPIKSRSAERNFQLMADWAIDANTQLLLMAGSRAPDTYQQSFTLLGAAGILDAQLAGEMSEAAKIRNVLVHEYDIVEDFEKFYNSVKKLLPVFRRYCQSVLSYLENHDH